MIPVNSKISSMKPSATFALGDKAKKLKAEGRNIIDLGLGAPDFDTPDFIKNAAKQALDDGKTKYTPVPGIPELRKAIQNKFKRDNDLDFALDEIIVGVGGKQILSSALGATLEPGDEVIIPAPYWTSYPDMVHLAGGKSVIIECGEDSGFKLTPQQLENAITKKSKWLILNSPGNPTGAVYSWDELRGLADILLKYPDIAILSDDIYEAMVYDVPFFNIAMVEPKLKSRCLITNGVSKSYSMTGWRLGYGACPSHLTKAIGKINGQTTSCATSITQWASLAALEGDQSFLKEWCRAYQKRRDIVCDFIETMPDLTTSRPDGAFYVYIGIQNLMGKTTPDGVVLDDDEAFVTYLLERENGAIAAVHGAAFGSSPYFRISTAASESDLIEACNRLQSAINDLK